MPKSDSRERMVSTAARLFRRQGYEATSWRQVAQESGAPWGSIAYLFPGGKEQLGVEAVTASRHGTLALMASVADRAGDPAEAVLDWFEACAVALERSGWADGCPVATVALETANESEALRSACRDTFGAWQSFLAEQLVAAGHDEGAAGQLATTILCTLEGALLVCRAERDAAPLRAAAAQLAPLLRPARATRRRRPAGS